MAKPIPFYLVVFNRVNGLKNAIDFVARSKIPLELIVLDMGSTWEPFIEFRDSTGLQIVKFPYGMGPRDLWISGELQGLGTGGFFLADGDIDYSHVASDAAEVMIELSEKYPWIPKVGLALKINDLPTDLEGNRIREWAKGDWAVSWKKEIFLSGLDTTTAYYPRRETTFFYRPALRIAGPYEAIHYPWYERAYNFNEEAKFYAIMSDSKISSTKDAPWPTLSFRVKRLFLHFCYRILKYPLHFKVFGRLVVRLLSFRGVLKH